VESHVELTNGRITKDEIATLSRALLSQKITKEQFKMLPNGFMVLEATVETTLDRKGITDKLETISQSQENKAKIAQIQADNTKLQAELEEVSKELSSLKDSTAALAQQLFAKREEIYKKLDANDNIVLTKLDKKEVLSQAVAVTQAYDKAMDDFRCKVNTNLYILEKILTPKVKSTKVDFDGKSYSLRVVVQVGNGSMYTPRDLEKFIELLGIDFYELSSDAKYEYIGFLDKQYDKSKMNFAGNYVKTHNPKTLDFIIALNGKNVLKDTIAYYNKTQSSYSKDYYIEFYTYKGREWKNYNDFLTKEYVIGNLSAEDVAKLDNISLQVKGNYEYSECVEREYNKVKGNYTKILTAPVRKAKESVSPKTKLLNAYLQEGLPGFNNIAYRDLIFFNTILKQYSGAKVQEDFLKNYDIFTNSLSSKSFRILMESSTWDNPSWVQNASHEELAEFERFKNKVVEYEKWRIETMFNKKLNSSELY
jgi:hypothetical protein